MATTHTGDPTEVLSPAVAPSLTAYLEQSCPSDGDDLDVASVNQALQSPGNLLAYIQDVLRNMYFGSGSDGAQTISGGGTTQQSAYQFRTAINITFGGLQTNGWPIIARTSIHVANNAAIRCQGGSATTSTRGLYNSTVGGPHGSIAPSNGLASGSYPYYSESLYGLGGNGGAGGGSATPIGTTILTPASAYKLFPWRLVAGQGNLGLFTGTSPNVVGPDVRLDALRGGGAGGPGKIASSSTGGAGGAGGGLVVLIAPVITLDAGALFFADGGTGGAGQGTTGHGGGGGGGGAFLFVCEEFNDAGAVYSAEGGTGGLGVGAGDPGNDGTDGTIVPYVVLLRS